MPYSRDVFSAAQVRLNKLRKDAEDENILVKTGLYQKIPRLREIEEQLAQTGISAAKAALSSTHDTGTQIEKLKKANLSLQAERAELLTQNGLGIDILEPRYHCPKCKDTGNLNGKLCDCFRALLQEEACRFANSGSPLPLSTFESFNLSYYPTDKIESIGVSPREMMEVVYDYCYNYASNINEIRENLLLIGPTGLGKTHLALAIANRAIAQGVGVIYDTAQNIFVKFEDEYFGRKEKNYTSSVLNCDLLVIDDLGSEFSSPYSLTVLYNILNTRTLSGKKMIVSTNLTREELTPRYNDRIVSRLLGEFHILMFFGRDIRQIKLKNRS